MTAFLLLLAFPPLGSGRCDAVDGQGGAHQLFPADRPGGFGDKLANISGGGSPLLWQHLFWFLAHPEVYVLILPAMGIVAEIIANNTRKPLWGYKSLVYAILTIGFLSFIVWAHHMYLTGHGNEDRHVLPNHHDDHFDPFGDHPDVLVYLAVGRVHSVQHADALRAWPFCRCSALAV